MALKTFKDIINNKGYRINSKDRKIFEEGNLQTFFGFGESDAIEFVVYDINDNQLPQINDELVRYIPMTTENIADYFLIAEGTLFQQNQFPSEYFVDVERILRESGYDNGIFKTQITLINKRVGSNENQNKLWISEISPSRTEVRLFPIRNASYSNPELEKRYNMFVANQHFRDDVINAAFIFIEQITPSKIQEFIKSKYSDAWLEKLKSEYKIKNFDVLVNDIYKKFIESATYAFTNRNSIVGSLNYGKPSKAKPKLDLSKNEVKEICKQLLANATDFYLTRLEVKKTATFKSQTDASMDDVTNVLKRYTASTKVDTSMPEKKIVKIEKPEISDKLLEFKRKLKKELPNPVEVDDPPPVIDIPIETPIESPPYYEPDPVVIEVPVPKKQIPIIIEEDSPPPIISTPAGDIQVYFPPAREEEPIYVAKKEIPILIETDSPPPIILTPQLETPVPAVEIPLPVVEVPKPSSDTPIVITTNPKRAMGGDEEPVKYMSGGSSVKTRTVEYENPSGEVVIEEIRTTNDL
jgi:hypothetical protein